MPMRPQENTDNTHWELVAALQQHLKPVIVVMTRNGPDNWTVRDGDKVVTGVTDEELGDDFHLSAVPAIDIGESGNAVVLQGLGEATVAVTRILEQQHAKDRNRFKCPVQWTYEYQLERVIWEDTAEGERLNVQEVYRRMDAATDDQVKRACALLAAACYHQV